jgi:hypothetical protein
MIEFMVFGRLDEHQLIVKDAAFMFIYSFQT